MHPRPLVPRLRHRAFAVPEALELGLTRRRLRAADLDAPTRGLRVPRTLPVTDVQQRCIVLLPILAATAFFSHVTAAMLWGLRLPERFERDKRVHVTVRAPGRVRRPGVVAHRTTNLDDIGGVEGLRVSRPLRLLRECATTFTEPEIVALADQIVVNWHTRVELQCVVERHAGERGIGKLASALEYVRGRVDSSQESILRWTILIDGLPEPEGNFEVFDERGRFVARVDLAYPEVRLAIEYEGRHHQTDRSTYLADIARRERLERCSWTILLVTDRDMRDRPALQARVRQRLRDLRHPFVA
jgi:hypothetical protein